MSRSLPQRSLTAIGRGGSRPVPIALSTVEGSVYPACPVCPACRDPVEGSVPNGSEAEGTGLTVFGEAHVISLVAPRGSMVE